MGTEANIVAGGASVTIGADLGYIKDGITLTPTHEKLFIENIETLYSSPRAFWTKEEYTFAFMLVETTQANLKIWLDCTNSATPPAGLDVGHGPSGDTGQPTERELVVTGLVPGADLFVRTITGSKVVSDSPGEFKITQFEEAAFPVSFRTLWDNTNSRSIEVQDATS